MSAVKHLFYDSKDSLKTGRKSKPQNKISLLTKKGRGAWVVPSDECLTLDFGSGHDPRVVGSEPSRMRLAGPTDYWVTPPGPHDGWPHEFCIESALKFDKPVSPHDSSMNQIDTGAISVLNFLLSESPHNVPASYDFTDFNLTTQNYNNLHFASITVISWCRPAWMAWLLLAAPTRWKWWARSWPTSLHARSKVGDNIRA